MAGFNPMAPTDRTHTVLYKSASELRIGVQDKAQVELLKYELKASSIIPLKGNSASIFLVIRGIT